MEDPIKIDVIAVYDCDKVYDRYTVVFDDIDQSLVPPSKLMSVEFLPF